MAEKLGYTMWLFTFYIKQCTWARNEIEQWKSHWNASQCGSHHRITQNHCTRLLCILFFCQTDRKKEGNNNDEKHKIVFAHWILHGVFWSPQYLDCFENEHRARCDSVCSGNHVQLKQQQHHHHQNAEASWTLCIFGI